ncbi:uncharacterized protein K489DRAFT_213653 [Dissoconium aciculare CBS 342.82]|uniref:Mei2-like C-terminal RNA recognition motif domain-containing protein n=1 Tax=Dissoconium aciculare CBS 342.82 TaxID=1314786 RepID=A0A6J3M3R8_9PEZI|nr:uncharacterized protein K489DRAFT_213653 [Dissoconium aciculare CBS 342.82]KAF1822665.1 hypothetical protein K489DRAFT_213653 [Dissoconium aciculare CBS 342.82]
MLQDWVVSTKPLKDPVDNTSKRSSTSSTLSQYHIVTTPHRISSQGANTAFTSPSGRTAWQQNEDGTMVVVPAPRVVDKVYQTPAGGSGYGNGHYRHNSGSSPHTPAPFNSGNRGMGNRNDSWSSRPSRNVENDYPTNGEPQSVNVERIMSGVDVRTTIMLRNLPNQWGASHMKSILDTTSWGCYDFSYLRIDFQRNTNVGYAFVNFCQATDIVPFYQTYIGREWDSSTPGRKRAQISYATIQGFDCLIEKFRNSSIMDEYAEFRPKIWWTKFAAEAEGKPEKIGTEKDFPAPNNISKKQRSHDNAGSIGLYAPRSGQRGTDRHRRSLYDRGTSAQIREDAMLNQMSPMGNNYTYQPGPGPIGPPPAFGQYYNAPPNYMGNAFFPVNDGNQGRFINQDPFKAAYHPQMPMYSGVPNYTPLQYNNNNVSIMGTNNPASGLRTISRGRLAGRPRNVTTAPNVFDGTAPAIEPAYGVNFNPVMYGEQGGPSSHSAPRSMHQHSQGPSTQHYQQHHASAFMPARGNVQHHGLPTSHQAGLILGPNEYVNSYGQIEMAGSSSGHFHQNGASLSPTQAIGYPQQNEYINGHGQVDMAESSSQAQMQARHST